MKKNVWILNHYATNMFQNKGGRHYWFAKRLIEKGYNPIIICASFEHKGTINHVERGADYIVKVVDDIPFVFVHVDSYQGNGKNRIFSMVQYVINAYKIRHKLEMLYQKPDVIIGSSVHPLTCLLGIKLSKQYKCKSISEIRDLWPETLVMLKALKKNGILTKILYLGEKWIYKKSDEIVFTMEGGAQYIRDHGWQEKVDLNKVHYINNGVDTLNFNKLIEEEKFDDDELDGAYFRVIYTGTLGKANDIGRLIEVAQDIPIQYKDTIRFLLYGEGEEKDELIAKCIKQGITNVTFKGKVNKSKIPYILSKADLLVVNYAKEFFESEDSVFKYGSSHNKLFEYLAAGKPILYTQPGEYNIVEKYKCGSVLRYSQKIQDIVDVILKYYEMSENEYNEICTNSLKASVEFDMDGLSEKLIAVIER